MSDAAKRFVETLQVKGSKGELLRAIAEHIPEGHTTTPPMTTDELATPAQQSEKTVRRNRDALARSEVIRVLDGGRGNVARYEILNLAGERPVTAAPLPLLGRPKPRPAKEVRKTLVTMTNLFDETSVKVTNVRDNWRARIVNVGQTLVIVTNVVIIWLANVGHNVRRLLPLDVDDARARDVHTFKEVHTHAPPPAEPADEPRPPPRAPLHPWHAWCGRVCVPTELHQECLRKGHEAAWLVAFYARRCAAIAPGEKITVNDFTFWRTALKAELLEAPTARALTPAARATFGAGNLACPHEPMCRTIGDCSLRIVTEARAEREKKSG